MPGVLNIVWCDVYQTKTGSLMKSYFWISSRVAVPAPVSEIIAFFRDTEHHQRWLMFSSWFVARSRPSSWVAKRPTLWRCLRRCSPASWGKSRRGWRSFSSVTMPRKVRSPTWNLNHVRCILPRIGQCCINGIPWFSIEHLQTDVSRSNCPRLEWWSSWGREACSSRCYQDLCSWKLLETLL